MFGSTKRSEVLPPLRAQYQLLISLLSIIVIMPAVWAFWHSSHLLAEYFDLLPGMPVNAQPNGWLWAIASMVVFSLGIMFGYLLLSAAMWIVLSAIGWPRQTIADLLRSRYPAHWYRQPKADTPTEQRAGIGSVWQWFVALLLIAIPAYLLFYALPQSLNLLGDNEVRVQLQPLPPSTSEPSPSHLREQMRARYRLPPDRRFSEAIGQLGILAGQDAALTLQYHDDSWWVSGHLGEFSFPELASFEAAFTPVRKAASKVLAGLDINLVGAEDRIPVHGMDPADLFKLLVSLDQRWAAGERQLELLQAATVANVRLAFVTRDWAGVDERVYAQALALLAMMRELGREMPLEESMLAYRLGYVSHAVALAEGLPATHPWNHYLNKEDEQLRHVIANDDEFAYLFLERLVLAGRIQTWQAAVQDYYGKLAIPPLHVLALGMRTPDMTVSRLNAVMVPVQVSRSLSEQKTLLNSDMDGPFLPRANYQAFHRMLLESGLFILARLDLDQRSSLSDTENYLKVLRLMGIETAKRHAGWLDALLASKQGKADLQALRRGIGDPALGMSMRKRSLDEWLRYASSESAVMTAVIGEYVQGLDSRIGHRFELAELAKSRLLHVSLMDELYSSIRRDEDRNSQRLAAFLSYYHDDTGGLFSLASDEGMEPRYRHTALSWLRRQPLTQQEMDALAPLYQALIDLEPKDWRLREAYLSYLSSQGGHFESLLQIRQWLALRDEDTSVFDIWKAAIAQSRTHQRLGEMSEAWAVIIEHLDSQYGPIFSRAVELSLAMGDLERAELIAQAQQQRYSSSLSAQLPMLQVFWRQGEYAAAAALLKDWHQPISMQDWRQEIGNLFTSEASSHGLDAHAAMQALRDSGISHHNLNQLLIALSHKQPALAMVLADELRVAGMAQISLDIDAYAMRRRAEGDEAAVAWLQKRLANVRQDAVAGIALERLQYTVPWRVAEPDNAPHPDAAWLYRATVVAMGMDDTPLHREKLAAYYARAQGSFYDQLGMMVLGMIDEDVIARQTMGMKEISEAAYYLGVRALSEGRYRDGAEWLRVSMETGQQRNGEYRWSLSLLTRWMNSDRSLAVLASRGALYCNPKPSGGCVSTDD